MDCLGKARREYYSRDILVFKHGGQRHIVYVCNLPTRPGIYYGTMSGLFIYARNIMLIYKKKRLLATAAGEGINLPKTAAE